MCRCAITGMDSTVLFGLPVSRSPCSWCRMSVAFSQPLRKPSLASGRFLIETALKNMAAWHSNQGFCISTKIQEGDPKACRAFVASSNGTIPDCWQAFAHSRRVRTNHAALTALPSDRIAFQEVA